MNSRYLVFCYLHEKLISHKSNCFNLFLNSSYYSDFKVSAGLTCAVFMVRKLNVVQAIITSPTPVITNTIGLTVIRYEKFCSQLFIAHQTKGTASTTAIKT